MPRKTIESLEKKLSLAQRVVASLDRKINNLELTVLDLRLHSQTCNLNAKSLFLLTRDVFVTEEEDDGLFVQEEF